MDFEALEKKYEYAIRDLLKKYGPVILAGGGMDEEDLKQDLRLALWRSEKDLIPIPGVSPEQLHYKVMKNVMLDKIKYIKGELRDPGEDGPVNLDSAVTDDGKPLKDTIPSEDNTEEYVIKKMTYEGLMGCLNERDREIFRLSLNNVKQTVIGRKFGLTQSAVSRIIRKSEKTVREAYFKYYDEDSYLS